MRMDSTNLSIIVECCRFISYNIGPSLPTLHRSFTFISFGDKGCAAIVSHKERGNGVGLSQAPGSLHFYRTQTYFDTSPCHSECPACLHFDTFLAPRPRGSEHS